ncbi:PREDICTED: golgin subfamily A member 6-like protein 22 [Ceratosolen solmsi marchali]|uniref:Golgin subfamily A member 6-like protein 22 n=1 Tax=Ceratosolen solmsi marchali TaxID=326594 RepID=A0AAJ7DXQ9_9HYME|nr:PREDICTED: golgin subfamily A member 6-like protein 22 [Ceratosolen solmsi marchali]
MRQNHKAYILKQIKQNEMNLKKITESTKLTEIEELKNMRKELHEIEEKEIHKELQKKEKLKKMFLEAIEDRKEYTLKVQDSEKFQEQNLKTYKDLKWNIDKLVKKKKKNAKLEEIHKLEILARKIGRRNERSNLENEEKDRKRIEAYEEQKRMEDLKLIEDKKQKRIKAYDDMKEQIKNVTDKQEKKIKEEMDLKLWETLQRYKRDEFNKEYDLQQKQAERSAEKKKAAEENDYSIEMNEMTNKANEKILSYGKKVLEESQGVRPLYPITKTIEAFKREIGLIAPFNRETDTEAPLRNIKRKGNRRIICTRPIKEEDAFYIL